MLSGKLSCMVEWISYFTYIQRETNFAFATLYTTTWPWKLSGHTGTHDDTVMFSDVKQKSTGYAMSIKHIDSYLFLREIELNLACLACKIPWKEQCTVNIICEANNNVEVLYLFGSYA
jgi:hypothetical protein